MGNFVTASSQRPLYVIVPPAMMPDEVTIAAFRDQLRESEVVNGLSANGSYWTNHAVKVLVSSGNRTNARHWPETGFWEMMTKVPDRLSATRK